MSIQPAIFEEHQIRRVYDEATETSLFSVIDIIKVLTHFWGLDGGIGVSGSNETFLL